MVVLTRSPPRSSRRPGPRRPRARARSSPPRLGAPRVASATGSSGDSLGDRLLGALGLGGRRSSAPPRSAAGSARRRGAVAVAVRRRSPSAVTLLWPAAMPSAIARTIRLHERIASSLPGMMKSASSGSQFVSTSAMIGTPSRRASRTASCSFFRSTMKTASGCRRRSATPPRFASSFSSSASIVIRSFAGSSSSWPSVFRRRSSCRCAIRSVIVRQFVSRPPSQRFATYGMPTRAASCDDGVLRLLLRADEEDRAAALREVAREVVRLLEQLGGLGQVDDVDAAALGEDEALHLRVPAAGLVAEVDSGLQELTHGDDCQGIGPFHG